MSDKCEPVVHGAGSHYSFMFGKPWNQMSAQKLDFLRFFPTFLSSFRQLHRYVLLHSFCILISSQLL